MFDACLDKPQCFSTFSNSLFHFSVRISYTGDRLLLLWDKTPGGGASWARRPLCAIYLINNNIIWCCQSSLMFWYYYNHTTIVRKQVHQNITFGNNRCYFRLSGDHCPTLPDPPSRCGQQKNRVWRLKNVFHLICCDSFTDF